MKKLTAIFLVMSMVVSMFAVVSVTVGAEDGLTKLTQKNYTWAADLNAGEDQVKPNATFGNYLEGTEINDGVLRITYEGTAGDNATAHVNYGTDTARQLVNGNSYRVKFDYKILQKDSGITSIYVTTTGNFSGNEITVGEGWQSYDSGVWTVNHANLKNVLIGISGEGKVDILIDDFMVIPVENGVEGTNLLTDGDTYFDVIRPDAYTDATKETITNDDGWNINSDINTDATMKYAIETTGMDSYNNSKRSMHITYSSGFSEKHMDMRAAPDMLEEGKKYTLKFYAKVRSGDFKGISARIGSWTSYYLNNESNYDSVTEKDDDWYEFTKEVTVSDASTMKSVMFVTTGAMVDVFIDDVTVFYEGNVVKTWDFEPEESEDYIAEDDSVALTYREDTWSADKNNGATYTMARHLKSIEPENSVLHIGYTGTAENSNITAHVNYGEDTTRQLVNGNSYRVKFDYKILQKDSGITSIYVTTTGNFSGNEISVGEGWKSYDSGVWTVNHANLKNVLIGFTGIGSAAILIDNFRVIPVTDSVEGANLLTEADSTFEIVRPAAYTDPTETDIDSAEWLGIYKNGTDGTTATKDVTMQSLIKETAQEGNNGSSKSMHIQYSSGYANANVTVHSHQVEMAENAKYTLQFYAKLRGGDGSGISIQSGNWDQANLKNSSPKATWTISEGQNGWKKYSREVTYSSLNKIVLYINGSMTDVFIDDIKLYNEDGTLIAIDFEDPLPEYIPAPEDDPTKANVSRDSEWYYDKGTNTPADSYSIKYTELQSHSGNRSMRINYTFYTADNGHMDVRAMKYGEGFMSANETYKLTFYAKAGNVADLAGIAVRIGDYKAQQLKGSGTADKNGWYKYEFEHTVSANASGKAALGTIGFVCTTTDVDVFIDDITLTKGEETWTWNFEPANASGWKIYDIGLCDTDGNTITEKSQIEAGDKLKASVYVTNYEESGSMDAQLIIGIYEDNRVIKSVIDDKAKVQIDAQSGAKFIETEFEIPSSADISKLKLCGYVWDSFDGMAPLKPKTEFLKN